jgi:DNA helicase-2/ATP-dependent DNA helicase PcrA
VIGRTRNGLERIATALEASGRIVQRSWTDHVAGAQIHVSTVHKAKGGEWDSVTVVDLTVDGFDGCEVTEEEQRLFYVAVTRARTALELVTLDGEIPWKVQL